MMKQILKKYFLYLIILITACKSKEVAISPMFEVLDSSKTGLVFSNKLTPTQQFNMFKYMYFYNGGGAGSGDFNNDGLIDVFFTANQGENKLYLNKGGLSFKDVTKEAKKSTILQCI